MRKENSPICERLMLAAIEVRTPAPVRKAGIETPIILPATTTPESTRMGIQFARTSAGSMSMPTETKKTAAKRSRTGSSRCSIRGPSPDSATSEPATKAPSATE